MMLVHWVHGKFVEPVSLTIYDEHDKVKAERIGNGKYKRKYAFDTPELFWILLIKILSLGMGIEKTNLQQRKDLILSAAFPLDPKDQPEIWTLNFGALGTQKSLKMKDPAAGTKAKQIKSPVDADLLKNFFLRDLHRFYDPEKTLWPFISNTGVSLVLNLRMLKLFLAERIQAVRGAK